MGNHRPGCPRNLPGDPRKPELPAWAVMILCWLVSTSFVHAPPSGREGSGCLWLRANLALYLYLRSCPFSTSSTPFGSDAEAPGPGPVEESIGLTASRAALRRGCSLGRSSGSVGVSWSRSLVISVSYPQRGSVNPAAVDRLALLAAGIDGHPAGSTQYREPETQSGE